MYRSAILFFCLFVGIGSVVPTNADTVAETRKAIEAIYHQRIVAYEHKNLDDYLASFTSDFVIVEQSGRVSSLTQVRDQIKRSMAQKITGKPIFSIQQITVKGNTAQAVIAEHYSSQGFTPQSKEAPNKVAYTLTTDSTMETLWIKTSGGWQEKSSRRLHYKYLLEQ